MIRDSALDKTSKTSLGCVLSDMQVPISVYPSLQRVPYTIQNQTMIVASRLSRPCVDGRLALL